MDAASCRAISPLAMYFLSLAPNLVPEVSAATHIAVQQAFHSALQQTEAAPLGQARVKQAEARVIQARSGYLPTVSFTAAYQEQDTSGALSRESSSLFGEGQSFTRLSLAQSFYEGGRDSAALNASLASVETQRQNLSLVKYNLFSTVAQSFYGILAAESELENLRRTIALAKDRAKEIASYC